MIDDVTDARRDLPSSRVTFLFSDIEGSTTLLRELGPVVYADELAWHRRIVREAAAADSGIEVDTQGDSFFLAFPTASAALHAGDAIRQGLADRPIRLRMGLHTGEALVTEEGYVGEDVHVAARVAAAAHGGQIVLTATTRADVVDDVTLVELGEHRFKDLDTPIAIFQLGPESHPPLRTISNTNLPRPASSFVGRERELTEVRALLRQGARLVTLTGPGGTGKTRLALEAAADLVTDTKAGVFWVDLAALREPDLVSAAIGRTLGAKDGLAEHIGDREMLLTLDNFEQVVDAATGLATLVEACPRLRLLVTSRERLRVRGEVEYAVPPLATTEAIELFTARSGLAPSDTVAELCRRLDSLPLAIELAAARTGILSPERILERIGDRLDLLRGGRDAAARQTTLRATISWSYELLVNAERHAFDRLAVFRGGWTLKAAEAVSEIGLDALESLVDKSLVRHDQDRFSMLETIAEFANERLAESGERDEQERRHADYFVALARGQDDRLRRGDPEEGPVAVLEADIDNLRAATERLFADGDVEGVRAIAVALPMYWEMRGLYGEARRWLDRAAALEQPDDETRRRLLLSLARAAYAQGDHPAAVEASDEAARLSSRLAGALGPLDALRDRAFAAWDRADWDEAERAFRERLALATEVDNGVAMSACRLNLAAIANKTRRHDLAHALLAENLAFVRSRGQARCEANTMLGFADTAVSRGAAEDGIAEALEGARLSLGIRDGPTAIDCLERWAVGAATKGDVRGAATILAATEAARESMGAELDEDGAAIRAATLAAIEASTPDAAATIVATASSDGRSLDLAAALERAAESR